MLKIGESLNSSVPKTLALLEPFDEAGVRALIRAQKEAGATVLDLNTALTSDEIGTMRRLSAMVAEEGGLVPMFDSPDAGVLCQLLEETGGAAFVNSVTLTQRREVLPLFSEQLHAGRELSLVALPVADSIPESLQKRQENIRALVEGLLALKIPAQHIYVDLVVEALATDTFAARRVLQTQSFLRETYPDVKTVCGLSNVSFGLPTRIELNCAFVATLLSRGLSSAILNVLSPRMRRCLASCEALLGEDEYCMNYLSLYRELDG